MSRFKIEHNSGQKFLVVQGQKGQQISDRECYAISNGLIPGLLRAELIRKGNTFRIIYNISGYISLREFLLNPLNKASFASLLGNILQNLKNLQAAYYNYQFIMLDMNAAMVNPTTQQVSFVYVPITFYDSGTNLKEFLLNIIQCCSFVPGENTDYVREYINILNRGINFSVFDLEEYINGLDGDNRRGNGIKKCPRCGSVIQPNMNFCFSCGFKITIENPDHLQGIYDPVKNIAPPQEQTPAAISGIGGSQMPYGETISNSCITNPSTPQPQSQSCPHPGNLPSRCVQTAMLYRMKNGEQVRISGDLFRIGKDPHNCEYCVRDNSSISRCHALIKRTNDRWYVVDLNSTNKTYVNNYMLSPHVDVELMNGASIKLANEDFLFNLY